MTFVYDIYVNFQNQYYDFYEWEKSDKIIHIKKIPIFEVKESVLGNILSYENKIDSNSLELFKDKTEIFKRKKPIIAVLLTNKKNIVAIELNKDGKIVKKSSLLLEEENIILRNIHKIDFLNLELTNLKKENIILTTRKEKERKKFLLQNFSNIGDKELPYLYFECYGKKEEDKLMMKDSLKQDLLNNNEKISNIIDNFFKLIGTNS